MNRFATYATAMALALLVLLGSWSVHENLSLQKQIDVSYKVRDGKYRVLMDLLDAETGQRGFMITGDETYLLPYFRATAEIPKDVQALLGLPLDTHQMAFVERLQPLVEAKLDELRRTIDLRRSRGEAEALTVVKSGHGKALMDDVRALIAADRAVARPARAALEARSHILIYVTLYVGLATLLALITLVVLLTRRAPAPVPPEIIRHQQSLDSIERSIAALLQDDAPRVSG